MRNNFLWGSSISAGQCEGGYATRGETVVDLIPKVKNIEKNISMSLGYI